MDSGAGSKDKNMYSFYIETVSIQNQARGNMPDTGAQPLCESSSSSTGLLTFSMKDYYAIRVNKIFLRLLNINYTYYQ